jgi:hypothetical protein
VINRLIGVRNDTQHGGSRASMLLSRFLSGYGFNNLMEVFYEQIVFQIGDDAYAR